MIWKKTIYDSLTGCTTICNAFATACSDSEEEIDSCYRSIILSLDCADMCRHLAILYVRGSENARVLAKACIEVCEKCAQEVSKRKTVHSEQVYAVCKQTITACVSIIDMGYQTDIEAGTPTKKILSLFNTTDLHKTLYN